MGAFATKEARSIYYTDGCDIQRVQIGYVLYWALNECNWLWKISLIPSMQANPGTRGLVIHVAGSLRGFDSHE